MALARAHVWVAGDLLKSADLNGEFNNILNNPISLISPSTGVINFALQAHTNLVITALSATSGSTGAVFTVSTAGTHVWTTSGSGSASGTQVAKNILIFTAASTSYTPSANVGSALVELWGAGGGGGAANGGTNSGGSGGGGGYSARLYNVSTFSTAVTITLGAAGTGGSVSASSGGSGGNSAFSAGTALAANGGVGGGFNSTAGTGGTASGGQINLTGWNGDAGDAVAGTGAVNGADAQKGVGMGGYGGHL